MEEPREGVAAGTREFVDDPDLRSVDRHRWPRSVFAFARGDCGEKFAAKFFSVKIRNLSTGVVALIDDDAVFVELRGELLVERRDAGERRVRHVHVNDAAAGGFQDFAAVFLPPIHGKRARLSPRGALAAFPPPLPRGVWSCF